MTAARSKTFVSAVILTFAGPTFSSRVADVLERESRAARLLQAADERRQASGLLGSPYFHPTGGDGLD